MTQSDPLSLLEALQDLDEPRALEILDRNPDPELALASGKRGSAMSLALRLAMPEAASRLLSRAPAEALREIDSYGWSLLTQAARAGHLEALKLISAVDSPSVIRHPGGVSALMCAAEGGDMACVEFLLPLSDLRARDCYGLGPLEFAAKGRDPRVAEFFLAAGCPPNPPGDGANALMVAAERGRAEMVELLLPISELRRGSDDKGWTSALSLAMENEEWECADLIAQASPLEEAREAHRQGLEQGGRLIKTEARMALEEARALEGSARPAPASRGPSRGI